MMIGKFAYQMYIGGGGGGEVAPVVCSVVIKVIISYNKIWQTSSNHPMSKVIPNHRAGCTSYIASLVVHHANREHKPTKNTREWKQNTIMRKSSRMGVLTPHQPK